MAHSIGILVMRSRLPAPSALLDVLKTYALPLSFSPDWNWTGLSGWLPMIWRGAETGCEVELEKLGKKERTAVTKAGYPEADTAVVLTTRDWPSLQAGSAFAAAIAVAAHGCIDEGEGEYLAHDAALVWARDTVASADAALQREAEAAKAREAIEAGGDIGGAFEAALSALVGRRVSDTLTFGGMLVVTDGGQRLHGGAWCVLARDGRRLGPMRYAAIRSQQHALLHAWGEAEPSPDQQREYETLDAQLAPAAQHDEQDGQAALDELKSWPGPLVIASVKWIRPGTVGIYFAAGGEFGIELVGSTMASVSYASPPLGFVLTEQGVSLG
jgi:hypothetical protein